MDGMMVPKTSWAPIQARRQETFVMEREEVPWSRAKQVPTGRVSPMLFAWLNSMDRFETETSET